MRRRPLRTHRPHTEEVEEGALRSGFTTRSAREGRRRQRKGPHHWWIHWRRARPHTSLVLEVSRAAGTGGEGERRRWIDGACHEREREKAEGHEREKAERRG